MNIGKALRDWRIANNLSQEEIAKAAGVSQASVSRWEKNINVPSIVECILLADYYKVSLDDIFDRPKFG